MTQEVIVIGAGGHARSVIDAALEAGFTITSVLDLGFHGQVEWILGCEVIGGPERLIDTKLPRAALLAIGDNAQRRLWFERLLSEGWELPRLIHPQALVSRFAVLGEATFVNAGAMINAGASIGDNAVINTGAIVDHESAVLAHSHVAPGARLAGRVTVGTQSFVGMGATVIQGVKVGARAVIGAGAAVIRDVADDTTVVGVPGRVVS